MGVFGGARSPELQGLYRVKGLHGPQRDLAQAREPPQTEPVPRFGVEVPTDKSEELGDVSRHAQCTRIHSASCSSRKQFRNSCGAFMTRARRVLEEMHKRCLPPQIGSYLP